MNRTTYLLLTLFTILIGSTVHVVPVAAQERVLTGELVILDGSTSRFRLVGYENEGSFTAPSNVSLEPFDGKPVSVTVGANRTVLDIVEKEIEVRPIEHGYEEITGYLQDVGDNRFTFAGSSAGPYEAPAGVDVTAYAGHHVRVRITEGRVTAIHLIGDPRRRVEVRAGCDYAGQTYSEGATLCQGAINYVCREGSWGSLGTACGVPAAPPPPPRNCRLGKVTVLDGSSVCQGGATVRCADGQWENTGVPCR